MSDQTAKGGKKQLIFLFSLFLLAVLVVAGIVVKSRSAQHKIIMTGDRAPEFRLQDLDGRYFSLSDFRGKVVMVHFWATWCPPCVEEMPLLSKLYPELAGNDFEMLAVSVDEGGEKAVRKFMQQNNLQVPVLLNPDQSIAHLYGTYKYPETYIMDSQGVVRYKVIGPLNWTDPETVQMLKSVIAMK
ncbi:MAG TPA: TlpA disulfide reductase family protein [Nitrospirota bacterium]|nr:TlpA disulfide reductase family protein [Nitrospirota bacterium]